MELKNSDWFIALCVVHYAFMQECVLPALESTCYKMHVFSLIHSIFSNNFIYITDNNIMFAYIYLPQTKKYLTVRTADIYKFNIDNYDSKTDTYTKKTDKLILPDGKKQTCQVLKLGGKSTYIFDQE